MFPFFFRKNVTFGRLIIHSFIRVGIIFGRRFSFSIFRIGLRSLVGVGGLVLILVLRFDTVIHCYLAFATPLPITQFLVLVVLLVVGIAGQCGVRVRLADVLLRVHGDWLAVVDGSGLLLVSGIDLVLVLRVGFLQQLHILGIDSRLLRLGWRWLRHIRLLRLGWLRLWRWHVLFLLHGEDVLLDGHGGGVVISVDQHWGCFVAVVVRFNFVLYVYIGLHQLCIVCADGKRCEHQAGE